MYRRNVTNVIWSNDFQDTNSLKHLMIKYRKAGKELGRIDPFALKMRLLVAVVFFGMSW